jgi:cellulose synthase/poly-beta-1,6-N-acetylglucosamine synthase-like glycosyltransferase
MIETLFISVGAVLVIATLPLVLELLLVTSAHLLPSRKRTDFPDCDAPVLTVIVPAHNEELLIGRSVTSLQKSSRGKARILVIAHNCQDATSEEALSAGAEVLVYNDPAASGKGHALRHGLKQAVLDGAGAVLVIDADSTVSENLIPAVEQAFCDGAEVLQCRYEMENVTERANAALTSLAFRCFTYIRPHGRERLGLSAGILGNGFAMTTKVLEEVPYEAFSVVEDLEYHLHLVQSGKRVRFIQDAVVSAQLPVSHSGQTVQRSRWEGGRLRVARMWLGPLLKQVLRGRLALAEPLLDLAGLPMAFAVSALVVACLLPVDAVRIYGIASLAIVVLHVLAAAWAGPHFFRTLRVLAMVPLYILWKFLLIPKLLRSSGAQAAWVRTARQ